MTAESVNSIYVCHKKAFKAKTIVKCTYLSKRNETLGLGNSLKIWGQQPHKGKKLPGSVEETSCPNNFSSLWGHWPQYFWARVGFLLEVGVCKAMQNQLCSLHFLAIWTIGHFPKNSYQTDFYRPRSKGYNTFGSVRPSVRPSDCVFVYALIVE